MPSSYPSGRFSLIVLRTALSAARRSAGSAARYSATVEAVMLTTIPAAVRGRELYGGRAGVANHPLEAGGCGLGTELWVAKTSCTPPPPCLSLHYPPSSHHC